MYYQNYEDYMRQVLGYPINDPNIYETYDYRNNYQNRQTYEDTYFSRNQSMSNQNITSMSEDEIKSCYPEIYHLVYPMVCKVCDANTEPITRQLVEKMTDEVYNAIEDTSTVVNIRVDAQSSEEKRSNKEVEEKESEASNRITRTERTPIKPEGRSSIRENNRINRTDDFRTPKLRTPINSENRTAKVEKKDDLVQGSTKNREVLEKVAENRQSNSSLRDLIRILLLFRLFGNQPNRPRPPRPPFPGGPGRPPFPGGRPPMGPGGSGRPPVIQPRDYQDYLEF